MEITPLSKIKEDIYGKVEFLLETYCISSIIR